MVSDTEVENVGKFSDISESCDDKQHSIQQLQAEKFNMPMDSRELIKLIRRQNQTIGMVESKKFQMSFTDYLLEGLVETLWELKPDYANKVPNYIDIRDNDMGVIYIVFE